jgi:hypothetical protein
MHRGEGGAIGGEGQGVNGNRALGQFEDDHIIASQPDRGTNRTAAAAPRAEGGPHFPLYCEVVKRGREKWNNRSGNPSSAFAVR